MRILLSGGGTAGHAYPALTVAGLLAERGHDVSFVGTPEGLEARLAAEAGIDFHGVKARGFDRSNPLSLIGSAAVIASSTFASRRLVARSLPEVVAGFGGYVTLPVGLAAVGKGVPLVLHEQNSVPGLANKVLARWAAAVGVTYEDSIRRLPRPERAEVTGNPVRPAVLGADRERGRASLGLDANAVVLLVFGGSRGARHINDALVALAPALMDLPSLQVLHVAGRIEAASVAERIGRAVPGAASRYRVVDYIDAMGDAIAAADVIVSRAGATSIAEVTAIGRAAILVPYPYATDDHQTLNAQSVEQAGGAVLVPDEDIDGDGFKHSLLRLIESEDDRTAMASASAGLGRRDATERVATMIERAGGRREETE